MFLFLNGPNLDDPDTTYDFDQDQFQPSSNNSSGHFSTIESTITQQLFMTCHGAEELKSSFYSSTFNNNWLAISMDSSFNMNDVYDVVSNGEVIFSLSLYGRHVVSSLDKSGVSSLSLE